MNQFLESKKSLFWFLVVNAVTTLRIFFAIIVVGLAATYQVASKLMFWLILAGGFTDLLDGWLARKFNVRTQFGALYDKGVDKFYFITVAFSLFYCTPFPSRFWAILFFFLLLILAFLEALLSLFGGFFAVKQNTRLEASFWGKLKMALEVFSICVWADLLTYKILGFGFDNGISFVAVLLFCANSLACMSGYNYWRNLNQKK